MFSSSQIKNTYYIIYIYSALSCWWMRVAAECVSHIFFWDALAAFVSRCAELKTLIYKLRMAENSNLRFFGISDK